MAYTVYMATLSPIYEFDKQLAVGKAGEYKLDEFFGRWYNIEEVPLDFEKRVGADRLFVDPGGRQLLIEYKYDVKSGETGNLIIETISNKERHKPGWALTCQADVVVWLLSSGEILAILPDDIRKQIPRWSDAYRSVVITNVGFTAVGLVVPLHEVRALAIWRGVYEL
jgi:hypothetical protein